MANVKITELTVTTDPASTDVLPIVDVTANTTKKVTIADLLENAGSGSASAPAFAFDADPDTGMYQVATNQLGFSTGGTNRLTIDSSGNVGIGAASTSAKLHISATDSTNSPDLLFLENLGTGNNTGSTIYFRNRTGTAFTDCTIQSLGSSTNNSELLFSTEQGAGPVEAMRINSSGNVGIGVSSPSAKLEVNGAATFGGNITQSSGNSTFAGAATFGGNVTTSGAVEIGSFSSTTAAAVFLGSGAVQAFRDSGVNASTSPVFIGGRKDGSSSVTNVSIFANGSANFAGVISTTGQNTVNTASSLKISQESANVSQIRAYGSDGSTVGSLEFRVSASDGAPSYTSLTLNNDGSATFAGTINGTTVGTSDERFKKNIAAANSQLADVKALGELLKNFDWNEDAPVNDEIRATRQLGLIAQEVEKVCPTLTKTIARTKQGVELTPETTDEEGNVTPATYEELDDSYKGISHDALIMKLLGAVAELSAKVAALESA